MSKYAMTFGGSYNLLSYLTQNNNYINARWFVDQTKSFDSFQCGLYINNDIHQISIGDGIPKTLMKGSIYFSHLEDEFKLGHTIKYKIYNKEYSVDDIIQLYFNCIYNELDKHKNNEPVDQFTLIIPIDYNKNDKTRLKTILTNAGIHNVELIEQPIAAYYGLVEQNINHDYFIAIDLGAHSLKVLAFKKHNKEFELLDFYYSSIGLNVINDAIKEFYFGEVVDTSGWSRNDLMTLEEEISKVHTHFETDTSDKTIFASFDNDSIIMDNTMTYNDYLKILNDSQLFNELKNGTARCVTNNPILKNEIKHVVYTGWGCRIHELQKQVNDWCQVNQDIINHEDVMMKGGIQHQSYVLKDLKKRIGLSVKNNFIDFISYNVGTRQESVRNFKLPHKNSQLHLAIYSGYKGMKTSDCQCLGIIVVNPSKYGQDNIYKLSIDESKEIKLNIYNKSNNTLLGDKLLNTDLVVNVREKEKEK